MCASIQGKCKAGVAIAATESAFEQSFMKKAMGVVCVFL